MLKAIVCDHSFPSLELQTPILASAGFELQEIQPICTTEDEVIRTCGEATVLLVQWAPITRRVLESLPRLRAVVRYGIGVNNIDLEAAKELGIAVANVPSFCVEEVSTHAVAMIISLAKRVSQDYFRIAHGGWGIGEFMPIPALSELTLGLVGFGAIARRLAEKARVFGFRIVAYDPYVPDATFSSNQVERVDWEELLRSADIISLHCPLVPETTHLINRDSIARMKHGVFIVNTARGPVIDEPALIEALRSGAVLGAGLDVFEQEPLPQDSPLRSLPNVVLTSHAASVSTSAVTKLQIKAAESARDLLLGRRPESALVWPASFASGARK
jgi:D-3-phosphoglycerate dehydrogenase